LPSLLDPVRTHYAGTFAEFGATARGVDWPDVLTQELRFVQLLKLCDLAQPFSLNDFGCGYGALASFLGRRHPDAAVDYAGYDIVPAMIQRGKQMHGETEERKFAVAARCLRVADYTVASGTFNVKLGAVTSAWEGYIEETLRMIDGASLRGFAINFLGPPHPATREISELYRTESTRWVEYCADTFGARTETFDDYGLREFTLYVNKQEIS
jgi:SAM-dependent methyltransferase